MELRDIETGSIDYNGYTIYFPTTEESNYITGMDKQTQIDNMRNKLQDKLDYFEFILHLVFILCLSFGILCIGHEPLVKSVWFLPCFIALSGVISVGLHNLLNAIFN